MADHLYLCHHKSKTCYDLGKIRTGGAIDHRLVSRSSKGDITDQMGSDYRDEILVQCAGGTVEILASSDTRLDDLLSMKFRVMDAGDALFGEEG